MSIGSLIITVIKKDIKNLHISVLPPDGKVRVSAPKKLNDDLIRSAIIQRLSWIRKQQRDFQAQIRQSDREMLTGESHYLWGKRYLLEIIETKGKHHITQQGINRLKLYVSPNTSLENKQLVLSDYYRVQLKEQLPPLINKWQNKLGVKASFIGVRRMKTKWGSCDPETARIWLNLELAKKPTECLEYILVHELIHLLERHHNNQFIALMDKYMPKWQTYKQLLKDTSIAEEKWDY